jgi:hypothetical protein
MSQFAEFTEKIANGIIDKAREILGEFQDQAVGDAKKFIDDTNDELQRWTKQLAKGGLTKDEFIFLVKSQKDLFDLHGLKQAGLGLIAAQNFRDAVIDLVINTAVDVFL